MRLLLLVTTLLIAIPSAVAAATSIDITYTIDGTVGTNGWYRGSSRGNFVVIHWHVSDPNASTVGCELGLQINGPTTGYTSTCSATDGPEHDSKSITVKIDADPPTGVAPVLARGADFNGWFNHPIGIAWNGADATSGIAACSAVTYAGPDQAAAGVSGGCSDNAGNFAPAPVSINYDATAPVLSKPSVESRNGSDLVRWSSSSPADTAVVQRWPRGGKAQPVVFRGAGGSFMDRKVAAGLEYIYAVQTFDQAGNASSRLLVPGLAKVLTMRELPYVPRVAAQPILDWPRVHGATYYNVQLYRGSKRVFAAWPIKNHLGLPAKWKWAGQWRHLTPGRYHWYVWAGLGRRSFARYRTIGNAQFIVPR